MISKRARRWTREDPYLVQAHFRCARDPFDPETNPAGFVNFGTAENHIVFDAIAPLLQAAAEIHEADAHYNELHGARFLRTAIAEFLGPRAQRTVSPDHIALASGASASLEMLAFVLCDANDAILIPTPYYPGFDHDLALRSEAHLHHIPLCSPAFELRVEDVERAHAMAVAEGRNVVAVLLNSPHNPLGHVYDESLIRGVVDLASRHDLHVIVDEIYAESLLGDVRHFSALRIESPLVHVVYGFAKDFGLSGYKVGILHSRNPEVLKAAKDTAYFYSVSMVAQRALAGVLRDPRLDAFWGTLRTRLSAIHREVTEELAVAGIPVVAAQGGIVLWLDLRGSLAQDSFAGERELCEQIFDRCRVNLSPGEAFHCSEPGWFRLCFTVPEAARREGLRRLREFLAAPRS